MSPIYCILFVLFFLCGKSESQLKPVPTKPAKPVSISRCTTWKDRDNPSGVCDCENIYTDTTRLNEVKGLVSSCDSKAYVIQAKLTTGANVYESTAQALADTGNTIDFNYKSISDPNFSNSGINCWNSKNRQRCKDFEVRYCCKPQVSCACVNCRFTIDNKVDYVKYNGNIVPFTGTNTGTNSWLKEKVFSFESCSDNVPGELEIKGTNLESSDHCKMAGLLLQCTASRTTSPWHNFVSDNTHWTVSSEGNAAPCQQEDLFAKYFEPYCYPSGTCSSWHSYHFISSLNTAGAKKIWGKQKTVTLKGSP